LWTFVQRRRCRVGLSHDFSNRAPAQSAGAELERFVEAIVQLIPRAAVDKFIDHPRIRSLGAPASRVANIFHGGFEQTAYLLTPVDLRCGLVVRGHAHRIRLPSAHFKLCSLPRDEYSRVSAKELLEEFGVATTRGKSRRRPTKLKPIALNSEMLISPQDKSVRIADWWSKRRSTLAAREGDL